MRVINKKIVIIPIFLLVIFVLLINFKIELKNKNNKLDEVKLVNNNINNKGFAIMIENDSGEYVLSDTNEWPSNMIYNEELSGCMNSYGKKVENAINYNGEINEIYIKTKGTLSCYLYFDAPIEDKEFTYTGECEEYKVRGTGYYQIELWGAQGGSTDASIGGLGGYTSGIIKLSKDEMLYVCVGQNLNTYSSNYSFNGGGKGSYETSETGYNSNGGGATDIRLVNGSWDSEEGLNSRIMVAAGGGGANHNSSYYKIDGGDAGGLIGGYGNHLKYDGSSDLDISVGGTQTSGGTGAGNPATTSSPYVGTFGIGGSSNSVSSSWIYVSGGGAGYYGGGAGGGATYIVGTAAGGSSFISGYAGVNAITSSSDRTHTNNTIHYSNKYFINGLMKPGVNSGNGKAKISFISSSKPIRNNTKLNDVRYIKDCINGSSASSSNHVVELQAIYNGTNIAKGKNVDATLDLLTSWGSGTLITIVDGDIDSSNYSDFGSGGDLCVTVDLGKNYDLDEIAVWHYWEDGRTYYDNYTYVSNDNENWIKVIDKQEPETSEGKRVNAYEGISLTIKQKIGGTLTCTNNTSGETSTTSIIVSKGDSITCTIDLNSNYTTTSLKIGNDAVTSGTSFTYDYDLSKTIIPTYYKYCSETTVTSTSWGSCSAYCGGGTKYGTEYLVDKYYTSHTCGSRTTSTTCNTQSCTGCYMVSIYDNYTLNCRSGRGTEYSMVTYFSPNQYLMFTYDSSGWYYNSTYGCYSYNEYLYYVGQSCP